MPSRHSRQYLTIQSLRAIAALLVVFYHCLLRWSDQFGLPEADVYPNGSAGVDIFFVVSGFVMTVSSQDLAGTKSGSKVFIWRRLVRIVPMYWLFTTLRVVAVTLAPHMANHHHFGWQNIVASYFFLPSRNADGDLLPVLPVGWTLSFEMLFYALFAGTLASGVNPLRVLVPVFCALAGLGILRSDDWPAITFFASDLPLEFVFGVMIGVAVLSGKRLSAPVALLLIPASCFALLTLSTGPILSHAQGVGRVSLRIITWGIPAASLVAASVSLEERLGSRLPKWVLALGAASYSIYLSHWLVVPVVGALVARVNLPRAVSCVAIVCAGMGLSAIFGWLCYRWIEAPLTAYLKTLTPTMLRRSAVATRAPNLP